MNLSKRMDKIEVNSAHSIEALATEERRKKSEALEEWRQQNCARITWDLFILIEGPKLDPDEYEKVDGEESVYTDSHLEFFAMLDRVQKYVPDVDGFIDMSAMSPDERAFAVCLSRLYDNADLCKLLNIGILSQARALGLGLALYKGEISVAEAVQRIDNHRGGPEWRQICYTNVEQEEIDSRLGIPTITEIPKPGLPWVDPGL